MKNRRSPTLLNPIALLPLLALGVVAKPNVVILFTDDQGTLDANCYGSKDLQTPNIDKLAETGVRFTQAYAHTVCCPARAALMTGRHPQRGGGNHWTQGDMNGAEGINMALEELTLAEALKPAGYRTALFGKWHLGAHRDFGPKKQGFDEFFGIRDGFIDNYNHFFLHGNGFHDLYEGTTPVQANGKYFPEMMTKRCLQFIEENKGRPFFLYAPFNIPHYPEQAPKEFGEPFKNMKDPARKSYATIMKTTDHYIGLVIDKLEALELRENTIIIYSADNGYYAGNRGFAGKWSHYEESLRVPLVIYDPRAPKSRHGKLPENMTLNLDIPATILDYAGVKIPEGYQGHSLVPLMRGESPKDWRTDTFCEHLMHHAEIPKWEGVRGPRYVYARYFEQTPVHEYLHDLKTDPDQLKNLAGNPKYAKPLAAARKRTDELRESYGGKFDLQRILDHLNRGKKKPKKK